MHVKMADEIGTDVMCRTKLLNDVMPWRASHDDNLWGEALNSVWASTRQPVNGINRWKESKTVSNMRKPTYPIYKKHGTKTNSSLLPPSWKFAEIDESGKIWGNPKRSKTEESTMKTCC